MTLTGFGKIASLLIVLFLTGCSSAPSVKPDQNQITFYSDPPGATISSGSDIWGVAPVTRVWTLKDGQQKGESSRVTAVWESGATQTHRIPLDAGKVENFTFKRPQNVAGLELDQQ